jgi:hypothetical protein
MIGLVIFISAKNGGSYFVDIRLIYFHQQFDVIKNEPLGGIAVIPTPLYVSSIFSPLPQIRYGLQQQFFFCSISLFDYGFYVLSWRKWCHWLILQLLGRKYIVVLLCNFDVGSK